MSENAINADPLIPPKRKRRWFQFSLRSLFIFVTLVAAVCGWYGANLREFYREQEVVQRLKPTVVVWRSAAPAWLDGDANRDILSEDNTGLTRERIGMNFTGPEGHWKAFMRVATVIKDGRELASFGDRDLAVVAELPELEELGVPGTEITDEGLARLASFRRLNGLDLDATSISDDGVVHLLVLSKLRNLELNHTRITDTGVRRLTSLRELRELSLSECPGVTDESVASIAQFPVLEAVFISGTAITASGIERLKKARPHLDVQ